MNLFVIILLWQHILYLCTLFLVQGGKWTLTLNYNAVGAKLRDIYQQQNARAQMFDRCASLKQLHKGIWNDD